MRIGQVRVLNERTCMMFFMHVRDIEVVYLMLGPQEEDENEWKAAILCVSGDLAHCAQPEGTVCEADVDWWKSETEEML